MANRQMPVLPVAMSLLASFMSAITLLGKWVKVIIESHGEESAVNSTFNSKITSLLNAKSYMCVAMRNIYPIFETFHCELYRCYRNAC